MLRVTGSERASIPPLLLHVRERAEDGPGATEGESSSDAGVASLVWVVVHPSDAPMGAGLFLFDESRQEVVRRLTLPDIVSPHALAWDGESLWLGGRDEQPAVHQLDPVDGREISRWPGVLRFDVETGELVRDDPFAVPGWITAIAFVR